MSNIFKVNQTVSCDLRKRNVIQSRNPTAVTYGTETVSYMAPKRYTLKNFDSLKSFKKK